MKFPTPAIIITLCMMSCSFSPGNRPGSSSFPSHAENLFTYSRVWNVQMEFTPADWEAMSPQMAGGFGPLGFFAPGFILEGDADGNNELSEQEFSALGRKWFLKWDENGKKRIDADQVEKGISGVVDGVNGGKFILSGSDGERNGLSTVLGVEFPSSIAKLEFEGQSLDSVSVRYKGNGTFMNARESGKFSLKIDLDDGYPGRGFAEQEKINLHNCITDPSCMIDVLSFKLFRDAGVPAPRTAYARLHISVPGQFEQKYYGLYSIVENVDKQFISDRFGTKKGAILKPVTPFLFQDLGDDWKEYKQIYDPKTKVSDKEKSRLIELCKLVTNASDAEFSAQIGTFLDIDELSRFLAVTVLISDLDGILGAGQNFYLYLNPKNDKMEFIPWDQDHSFGQFKRTQEEREKLSILKPWDNGNYFLERLFKVEEFKKSYLANLVNFNNTLFQPERIIAQVNDLAHSLRSAVEEESPEKLELFNRLVTMDAYKNESSVPEGFVYKGLPGGFGSAKDVKPAQVFVVQRTKSVKDQLEGRSEGMSDDSNFTLGQMTNSFGFSKVFFTSMDKDNDGFLTSEEFEKGFTDWYKAWSKEGTVIISTKEVRAGLNSLFEMPASI